MNVSDTPAEKASEALTGDATAEQLRQVLQVVKEIQGEQRNEKTRRSVWSGYVHAIVFGCIVAAPFLDSASEYAVGYFTGSTLLISMVHGLSMRPLLCRWRLTAYYLIALLLLWTWAEVDLDLALDLFCVMAVFFLSASTLASIVGAWLNCGLLPPDEPTDRTPRPNLLHIFALTASYACVLALARWVVGSSGFLGGDAALVGLAMVSGYGAACSLIGVGYWGFVSRWKGVPNACTGVLLLFLFQMLTNVMFAITMNFLQSQPEANTLTPSTAISILGFCGAQVAPLAIVVNVLLLTGHRASAFVRQERGADGLTPLAPVDPLA